MTLKKIIRKYLEDNGYDGLYNETDQCSCEVGELITCSEPTDIESCNAGYKTKCIPEECHAFGNCDWHISPNKEEK